MKQILRLLPQIIFLCVSMLSRMRRVSRNSKCVVLHGQNGVVSLIDCTLMEDPEGTDEECECYVDILSDKTLYCDAEKQKQQKHASEAIPLMKIFSWLSCLYYKKIDFYADQPNKLISKTECGNKAYKHFKLQVFNMCIYASSVNVHPSIFF